MDVTDAQALAFRAEGQHLHRRGVDPLVALGACGVQDSPPGWAPVALAARCTVGQIPPEAVQVSAMRQAPFVVPRADLPVFTQALVPEDDAGLKAFVGARPAKEVAEHGLTPRRALDLVAEAARDALVAGPLELVPFHAALRERLPGSLLPYCRGCDSHHVRSGFWRGLGPLGVTVMPRRSTWALRPDAPPDPEALAAARQELARRFLRTHGPATHTQLAAWAGCGPAHAKVLLASVAGETETVRLGGRPAVVLAADRDRLATPAAASGVRLLGGFDPYVAQPDRERLVPDPTTRKALYPAIGRPGVVLRDGEIVGLWRARKKRDVLEVEVTWSGRTRAALDAEADAVARLRGCGRAAVRG